MTEKTLLLENPFAFESNNKKVLFQNLQTTNKNVD